REVRPRGQAQGQHAHAVTGPGPGYARRLRVVVVILAQARGCEVLLTNEGRVAHAIGDATDGHFRADNVTTIRRDDGCRRTNERAVQVRGRGRMVGVHV